MARAPLTTRNVKRGPSRDDVQALKRRVASLARLERSIVHLADGPALVRLRGFRNAALAVKTLRERGRLDRRTLAEVADLDGTPLSFERSLFATFEHDLAVLSSAPARELVREHRRALSRHGTLDREWLDAKAARLGALRAVRPPTDFSGAVVELVTALRGDDEGAAVAKVFTALEAEPARRREAAFERVWAIATAMETGDAPDDVRALYERLDASRDFPGRARRRRLLDVLRRAIGWADLPASLIGDDLVDGARRAIAMWPVTRDEETMTTFATLALAFRLGHDGPPSLDGVVPKDVLLLREHDVTIDQAVTVTKLAPKASYFTRARIARHVAAGLDPELLRPLKTVKALDEVASLDDVRAARAFVTWSTRLADHYRKHGLEHELELSPRLFRSLPRSEDLAVLTLCLLDQHAEPTSDPIATLDATLGLFARMPGRAAALLETLRRAEAGEGRRLDPAFADWLDDDALLDRSIHLAKLAGEPGVSAAIREDFDRAARRERESGHLSRLTERSPAQERRLEALLRSPALPARRDRTIRRLRARIEGLLPRAYRRAMDETFRHLLREGWNIRLPRLTPAWREAVRFWLLVDQNRELLEKLLREAAQRPGRSVKDAFPGNGPWLEKMRAVIDVDAWVAPRRAEIEHGGARYVLELEEDPLEVLRMGIPFGTCLSLDSGSNAASTVLNAIDANKRVLYVRNAAGKIVARKLLALTDEGRFVGYRLYRSLGGEEERAITEATRGFCEELAAACRALLTSGGTTPKKLHKGFWYDDGEVAFRGESGALERFCEAHGLARPPPELDDDVLLAEAEAWVARETNDAELALRVLRESSDTPAMRVHDAWTIHKIGLRRALRVASEHNTVAFALFNSLAKDEDGLRQAIDLASRLPEHCAEHRLWPALRRFPPSEKTNAALVELALRAMRRDDDDDDDGHIAATLDELPPRLMDVASGLDLLDAIEPAWRSFAAGGPQRPRRLESAVARAVAILEEHYEATPVPEVVEAALMSRRRGEYVHRAALRIAARHELPEGARALHRFAVLRPDLMKTGDGFAALVRQSKGELAGLPEPDECPFPALRELVAVPGLHRWLGRWDALEGDPKSTWEAAWRRRRRDDPPGGYDAVEVEAARRALVRPIASDDERSAARNLVLAAADGEVVAWAGLVSASARLGDGQTARRVLEEIVFRSGQVISLAPRVLVDLWRIGERDVVVKHLRRAYDDGWSGRVLAVEREAAARGVDVSDLLEAVARDLVVLASPDQAVAPDTTEQLRRVLEVVARETPPAAAVTAMLAAEDAFSVLTFREALARQPATRVAAIKEEFGKREGERVRVATFLSWIRDIGGIEAA